MGRFKHLVDSPADMEGFRAKYHIPLGVGIQYCPLEWVLTDREVGEVVIPMITFIGGGITLPMGRITRDIFSTIGYAPISALPICLDS